MGHKRRGVLWGLLTLVTAACIGGFSPCEMTAYATGSGTQNSEELEPVELEAVDKTKGVTYIYSETGSLMGINLNGNSVIIEPAEKPDDTGTSKWCKIYIDTNQNGVVDEGETAQKLPTVDNPEELTEYILAGPPIYGVYKEKTTEPITIKATLDGQTLYGVFEGESAAVALDISGSSGSIYGASNSVVTGDMTLHISGNPGSVFEASNSTVTGNVSMNSTGVSSGALFAMYGGTLTGNVTMTNHNVSASTVMAAYNGTVTGDVTLNMSAASDFTGSCGTVFGANATLVTGKVRLYHDGGSIGGDEYAVCSGYVHSEDATEPAVLVEVKNGSSSGRVGAAQGAEITSKATTAVKYSAKDHKLNGTVYILNGSSVKASGENPVALDLDVTGTSQISGSLYGLNMTGNTTTVVGDVDMNLQIDTLPSSPNGTVYATYGNLELKGSINATLKNLYLYNFYGVGGYYSSTGDSIVTGDVTVDMKGCQISSSTYIANSSYVKGAVTFTGDAATSLNYVYYAYNSTVEKNVTASLYGIDADTSKVTSSTVYGVNYKYKDMEYSVGQNVDAKLLGGTFYYLYLANYDSIIAGDATLEMKGIEYTSSSYIIYSAKVGGDVTITTDETCMMKGTLYGVSGSDIGGNVRMDVTNAYTPENTSNYNYFYGFTAVMLVERQKLLHKVVFGIVYMVYIIPMEAMAKPLLGLVPYPFMI